MDSPTKISLIAVFLVVAFSLFISQAYASSWDASPLAGYYPSGEKPNVSYHPDYIKHKSFSPKSYSWQTSKVCGLELCKSESTPHLQGLGSSGGIEILNGFDGKFFIKGFFPF